MRSFQAAPAGAALLAAVLTGCGGATAASAPQDPCYPVADFALTERSGKTIHRDDLKGKVWVASFIFTCCNQACPQITRSMADLQDHLAGREGVLLVSFSVNPTVDDPATLRAYADSHGADPERWLFLTGEEALIYRLIRDSFHLHVEQNQGKERTPGNEVMHSPRLVLVDRQGQVRGYYDATQPEEVAQLRQRLAVMLSPLPAVNAGLNGLSAALLVIGYVTIRARRVRLHKACMLLALGVSAVFLASYLYYHLVVAGGQPTRFQAEGLPRLVYLGVLLSHTVLAIVAAPLALFTAYQGLRGQLPRHVRVARWTLPIWLYVSLTGVVVYWMLYHLYPSA
jgi:protein SCO1/2/putative membrane protein